jgi:hypothetical protein
MTGHPVSINGVPSDVAPVTYPPTIGYPTPIGPGPTVVPPTYGLHPPMQMMQKPDGN